MPRYELISDFGGGPDVSVDPYWIMAVVRLDNPISFSHVALESIDVDVDIGGRSAGPLVLIASDCVSLQISNTKAAYAKQLSATIRPNDKIDYYSLVLPGDWMVAWIVNDRTKAKSLLSRLKNLKPTEPCNEFLDGLKFIGRVHGIRRKLTTNPITGIKSLKYNLQAFGFKELATTFFYDQSLAQRDDNKNSMGKWLANMGAGFQKAFVEIASKGDEDNVNVIIPLLIDTIVGTGIAAVSNESTSDLGVQVISGGVAKSSEAPLAYLVPTEINTILGLDVPDYSKESGVGSYADILHVVSGIQAYGGNPDNVFGTFVPDSKGAPRRLSTGVPMLGYFLPYGPEFSNVPLWEILRQYLNPVVNEMYTCLRVNSNGRVFPTVVLRQIPLTTDAFAENPPGIVGKGTVKFTAFTDLPRWVLDDALVKDEDFGRSDTTRCNFVHVYGQNNYERVNLSTSRQIVINPPKRDDIDIQRSGLHALMGTVACRVQDEAGKTPSTWLDLIADWSMGSHLTENGTLVSVGLHHPICEGDNVEHNGIVYHIEGITHSCSIDENGGKQFTTTISCINGIKPGVIDGELVSYPGFDEELPPEDPPVSTDDSLEGGFGKTSEDGEE